MVVGKERWRSGDLVIDAGLRAVIRGGESIELPRLSFALLRELLLAAPNVLTLDELMTRVWSGQIVSLDTVTQRVKLLRDALGDSAREPRYILGVRGSGYRWMLPVRLDQEPAAASLPALAPAQEQEHAADTVATAPIPAEGGSHGAGRRARAWSRVLVVPCLSVLLAVAAAYWFRTHRGAVPAIVRPQGATLTPAQAPASRTRVAVLRFANASRDDASDYLASGIAGEVGRRLAQVRGLAVVSALDVAAPADGDAKMAERLRADWLLEGSVARFGDTVHISVLLRDPHNGRRLWSHSYRPRVADLRTTADAIAAAAAAALGLEPARSPLPAAVDGEAYLLTLRALELTRTGSTLAELEQAIALQKQALDLAPDYAAPWAGIAQVEVQLANQRLKPASQAFASARKAAARALALDLGLALAHTRLGTIAMYYDDDLPAAALHLRRGYQLDPTDDRTIGSLSILLRNLGQFDAAVEASANALLLDPLNPRGRLTAAYTRIAAGQHGEAIGFCDLVIQAHPVMPLAHYLRGLALLMRGDLEAAGISMRDEPLPARRLEGAALVAHAMQQRAAADAALAELESLHAVGRATAYMLASVHAYRGEVEAAFGWLERAAVRDDREYDPDFAQILVDPLLTNLHRDPRWTQLMQRLGRSPEAVKSILDQPPG